MIEDAELLRRYVAHRDQAAFTELVQRRINLVYSVALRHVGGDTHLAEDVAQKVFADFARKAPTLLDRPVLSGWLYRSAQFAASDVVRKERRRRVREHENVLMNATNLTGDPPTDWDRLRPLLDDAMRKLEDPDRDAIALRFFESRAFADIGRALSVSEEAARKRVDRALAKLADALSHQGVTSTAVAVGAALAHQGVAAPAGLAATIAGSVVGLTAGGVAAGVLTFMTSTKILAGIGTLAVAGFAAAVYQNHEAERSRDQLSSVALELEAARTQNRSISQRLLAAESRAAAADADNARLLAAIQSTKAARSVDAARLKEVAPPEPLTHDTVEARYKRAQQLARTGDPAEALRELLWCFDEGMPRVIGYGGVRFSFLLSEIARLGEKYPPALTALSERRDKAEARLRVSAKDHEAISTFAAMNRYLKQQDHTLTVFDQFPADDPRRAALARGVFDELLVQRRYADAALGRSFREASDQFDRSAVERAVPSGIADPERLRKAQRDYLVSSTAKHVEMLAGSGQTDQARLLANKLIALDGSAETRAVLQRHVERAGHAELLRAGGL